MKDITTDRMSFARELLKHLHPAGTIFPETQKNPRSEEQGMKYQSLDFPASAHPDASTVLGCARRLQAIAVACRTFVRPFGISAWRIKLERFLSVSQMAQSQQIQGIQAVEMLVSGAIKNSLLPTCCLRIAAQGCAGRQVGSSAFVQIVYRNKRYIKDFS